MPDLAGELPGGIAVAGAQTAIPDPQALARLLGGGQTSGVASVPTASLPNTLVASRMHLAGVVDGSGKGGLALIAIDGKPARPYPVGSRVDGELFLLSVTRNRAALGPAVDGPVLVTLELPQRR